MKRAYNIRHNDVCRRCLGEGFTVTESVRLGHNRFSEPEENVCTLCGGTGLVQVDKEINVTITPKTPMPYAKK